MALQRHQTYGSVSDPIHKSHLLTIAGPYACPRRFALDRLHPVTDVDVAHVHELPALGTATHELIAAYLSTGQRPSADVRAVELDIKRWLAEGLTVDPDLLRERAQMVIGLFRQFERHVARVIACESGFIAPFGPYWLSGHVDLVYAPTTAPDTIALADWKTGANKPHPLELTHGWEGGTYSAALRHGYFMDRAGRDRHELEAALIDHALVHGVTPTFGAFPSAVHHVHLADYVPYARAGSKVVKRVEDLAFHGYATATKHSYRAGDQRGGAWIPVPLREGDLRRFEWRLRQVIGSVRLGRLFDMPGEGCTRCRHQVPCLNDGYAEYTQAEQLDLWNEYGKDATNQ